MIPEGLTTLLGGVGLFLFGMHGLTSDLRLMASDRARGALRRFAGQPVPGFLAGAGVTALILVLAANTAFNGFPVLGSILAQDRFLPRQLHTRGDRLAFSNGILFLAFGAVAFVVAF